MAVLKRKVNSEAKGFAAYAGEDPKPGVYRARLIKAAIRKASTDRLSYNVMYELAATKEQHKQFDGYTGFCEVWLGDEEWAQAKESSFIKAITGKSNFQNANVAYTGKEADFDSAGGAPITAIDGTKVENKIINIDLRMEKERTSDGKTYPAALKANGVLPWKKLADADDEDDIDVDEDDEDQDGADEMTDEDPEEGEEGEEMSDEEWEAAKEARRTELKSRAFGLDKLKSTLTDNGVDIKGMKKPEMVDAIIALEFPEDEEGDDETEEEETGIEESDVESDEDEEEEDDEDEEDEDEEDEEEEDLEALIREEVTTLDRTALKKELKNLDSAAGFKKSETDDDLRERLVVLKLENPGF